MKRNVTGCTSLYLINKLQKVQNAAARLVCEAKKSVHIHPILATLHWLPVTHRIQYKISSICFNSISGTAPQYLSDLLQPYTPARKLRSASNTRTFARVHYQPDEMKRDRVHYQPDKNEMWQGALSTRWNEMWQGALSTRRNETWQGALSTWWNEMWQGCTINPIKIKRQP